MDFDETVGSVTFSAGQQFSTPFSVKITDDNISEGLELLVTASSPQVSGVEPM